MFMFTYFSAAFSQIVFKHLQKLLVPSYTILSIILPVFISPIVVSQWIPLIRNHEITHGHTSERAATNSWHNSKSPAAAKLIKAVLAGGGDCHSILAFVCLRLFDIYIYYVYIHILYIIYIYIYILYIHYIVYILICICFTLFYLIGILCGMGKNEEKEPHVIDLFRYLCLYGARVRMTLCLKRYLRQRYQYDAFEKPRDQYVDTQSAVIRSYYHIEKVVFR